MVAVSNDFLSLLASIINSHRHLITVVCSSLATFESYLSETKHYQQNGSRSILLPFKMLLCLVNGRDVTITFDLKKSQVRSCS